MRERVLPYGVRIPPEEMRMGRIVSKTEHIFADVETYPYKIIITEGALKGQILTIRRASDLPVGIWFKKYEE